MKNETTGLAKALTKRAKELGIEVKHSHALELLASLKGERNWHVMASDLKEETTYSAYVSAAYGDFEDFPFTFSVSDKGIDFNFECEDFLTKTDISSLYVSRGLFELDDFFDAGIGSFNLGNKVIVKREDLSGAYNEGLRILFDKYITSDTLSFDEDMYADILKCGDTLVGKIQYHQNDKGWFFSFEKSFMEYVKHIFEIGDYMSDETVYRIILESRFSNGYLKGIY